MTISDRQRAHARRHATQDAKKHAYTAEVLRKNGKPTTWTPERVQETTEYQATISGAPKREPARSQWKEQYAYSFTAYMRNAGAMLPDPLTLTDEEYAEIYGDIHEHRNEEPPAPKVQVTKDGPAYLLPGVDPAPKRKDDTEQMAMF